MHLGCETWLMLIQPAMHVVAMKADTCAASNMASVMGQNAAHWDSIIVEYSNVFEPPGMPADRDTVNRIKLKPGSIPPYKW